MDVFDKVDPVSGRRYREFGNSREYEPEYIFTGSRVKETKNNNMQHEIKRRCPFRSTVNDQCRREQCAFFVQAKDSCCLAIMAVDSEPIRDTAGAKCPINRERRVCDATCAIYRNGCMITSMERKKT